MPRSIRRGRPHCVCLKPVAEAKENGIACGWQNVYDMAAVDRGYRDKQANCAQDAILRRQPAKVCRNGWMFKTALAIVFDTCLCVCAGGDCRVTVYFRCHVLVRPDGWGYTSGGLSPWTCTVKPIAVRVGCRHVPLHTRLSSVIQSHRTGRDQVSDSTSQTCCNYVKVVGPRAPRSTLSWNCGREITFPRGVDHSGWPRGKKVS